MKLDRNTFYLLLVSWFLFSFLTTSTARQPDHEKLLTSLPLEKDTSYVNALIDLIEDFDNRDTAIFYAQKAYDLSGNLNFQGGKTASLYSIIENLRLLERYEPALEKIEEILPLIEKSGDHTRYVRILIKKAYILTQTGQSEAALRILLESLQLTENAQDQLLKYKVLFELGDFYRLQKEADKALGYFNQALAIINRDSFDSRSCRVLFYIASTHKVFIDKEKIQNGIDIYREMLNGACREDMNEAQTSKLLNNLGSMYVQIGDFTEAKKILQEALVLKRALNNPNSLAYTLNELSSLHFKLQEFDKSLAYAEEAYALLSENSNIYVSYDILENLAVNHEKLGDFAKAYQFQSLEYKLRDSILNQEKAAALAEMETKYSLAKKQQEIVNKDLEIATQQSTFNRSMSIGLTILFLIIVLLFWYRYRLSKQKLLAAQLAEMDRLKSNFFTNITHEFRTPLTLIINNLPESPSNQNASVVSNESIGMIRNNANRLLRLINQLMDLSKLEAQKMKLQICVGDLDQFLRNLVETFQPLASQKEIRLQYLCLKKPEDFYFDKDKVEKIVSNLISNAIKFGKEKTEASVVLDQIKGFVTIKVIDQGIGISENDLTKIFDRFQQADQSPTRDYEGTGIGLALTKQLVEIHRGRIEVFSEKGKGSTFTVFLPLGKQHFSKEEIQHTQDIQHTSPNVELLQNNRQNPLIRSESGPLNATLPKVLIIEDHPGLRQMLENQLQKRYSVIQAENGKAGIAAAMEHLPDLIICDVMMPKLDGYQVCNTLKTDSRTKHIPIIMLTAKTTQEEKLAGLSAGADVYMVKPFDQKELEIRISNLIHEKQKLKQLVKKAVLQPEQNGILSRDEAFLAKINKLIESEIDNEQFGVEELSQLAHLSRSQIYRKIKNITDRSPNAYIRKIRMERAHQLLKKNAGNVSEIALMVGFSNTNYFYKCFKDEFGITPGELLKSTSADFDHK